MRKDNGFYSVNGAEFQNKLDAVLYAQQTNSDVQWHFFDEIFEKTNWSVEPTLSLDDFYRIRAQQIRDSYDYVVVFCSGGADSTNVIKSFLNNNIKVDEVVSIAPISGLKNWNFDPTNVSETNAISEIKFALFPLLNELKTYNIKITIVDYFEELFNTKDDIWMFEACGNITTPLTSNFTNVTKVPHLVKLMESGKKIALVYGGDKPVIKASPTGDMFFVFGDGGTNYLNLPESRNFPNVDRVFFYYTPDLPDMLVKQSHVVARALCLPHFKDILENEVFAKPADLTYMSQNFLDTISQNDITKEKVFNTYVKKIVTYTEEAKVTSYRSLYQRAIVPYIYPSTYTKNLWQAQKINITEAFFLGDHSWIHLLHKNTKFSEMIISGSNLLYNSISPRFLNYKGTGFLPFSKKYKFGNISNFRTPY